MTAPRTPAAPAPPAASAAHRLFRARDRRLVAGVAAGIARHVGVPVLGVRIAFVVLLGFNGVGLLLYAAFWAVLPVQPDPTRAPRPRDLAQLLPFVAIAAGVILLQALFGLGGVTATAGWLFAVIGVGAGIIWHQADPARRWKWEETLPQVPWLGAVLEESDRRMFLLRFIGGGVLVAVGIIGIAVVYSPLADGSFSDLLNGVLFALIGLAGVALVAAPVLWRTYGQLRAEREGRIRETERAELAAMVHDQVLHTLALIQRNAADTKTVQRLARGQERSLRNWLYKPSGSPNELFAAAVEQIAAEVEDTYAITVETVVVGDRQVDERIGALVAAAREAVVNAARHAKVQTVSLYAEVEPEQLSVFVRDRGAGFDPGKVEDDRHGVRGSIIGRMRRHGGWAEIRSEPGEGTEVRLIMPAPATARDAGEGKVS
ncbi:ATP-binding protein [Rhizomonospora bruguierae]|uniref:ATP-binding protein n=1 Tax=Rhizomonospora bruguierae TaxID=1581705 RepID=UPI001BD0331A|nr:ATP-binding protein [Micromonospora sp. NBRC 107566]